MAQLARPLRGSRISSFYPVKSLPSLASLDSAFQLQEYISLLIRLDVHDVDAIVAVPGAGRGKEKEKEKERDPEKDGSEDGNGSGKSVVVDEACWKYEQLRRLAQDLSHPLITSLQQVCTRTTCPEMKAGEWLYLCVAHGNDGAMEQCCAIDYILHTLDSATALLNSPRAFPSRLQIPATSHRHFSSLARRLGRIFAHAYFHHREEFEQAEAESSLYARFLALTERFDLVPADFLVIPPRVAASAGEGEGERRGSGVPAPGAAHADAKEPTLGGAALQIDTSVPAPAPTSSSLPPSAGSTAAPAVGESPSPSSDDAGTGSAGARRYGRSRTDTMMLLGDAAPPSPASPASAVQAPEVAGLDAVLAGAMQAAGPEKEKAPEPVAQETKAEPGVQQTEEVEHAHDSEAAVEESQSEDSGAPVRPPGPEVTPSSSTAPQHRQQEEIDIHGEGAGAHAHDHEQESEAGDAKDAEPEQDAEDDREKDDSAEIPSVVVEPATPEEEDGPEPSGHVLGVEEEPAAPVPAPRASGEESDSQPASSAQADSEEPHAAPIPAAVPDHEDAAAVAHSTEAEPPAAAPAETAPAEEAGAGGVGEEAREVDVTDPDSDEADAYTRS